jgi:hypothetical protein
MFKLLSTNMRYPPTEKGQNDDCCGERSIVKDLPPVVEGEHR